jgi:hypothetical protein
MMARSEIKKASFFICFLHMVSGVPCRLHRRPYIADGHGSTGLALCTLDMFRLSICGCNNNETHARNTTPHNPSSVACLENH